MQSFAIATGEFAPLEFPRMSNAKHVDKLVYGKPVES